MAIVTEISWDDMLDGKPLPETPARKAWREAVAEITAKAHEKLPECNGRIERAVKIVLAGDVELLADGTAKVASQSNGTTAYHIVNGTCTCRDFDKAPHQFCKHRLSAAIARRAQELVKAKASNGEVATAPDPVPAQAKPPVQPQADGPVPALPEAPGLPEGLKPFIVHLHGKPFVQYAGLLFLAHERGLVSLKAHFISVTSELTLAEAEATFADGKTYGECADATPSNVGATVKAHFPRLALTRAKARTLRDALKIGIAALEELEGE